MLPYHNNQPDCLFCRICLFGAGPIPALKALTNLKNINLGENLWSGLVPDLSQLSKLQELNLHNAIGKTTQGFHRPPADISTGPTAGSLKSDAGQICIYTYIHIHIKPRSHTNILTECVSVSIYACVIIAFIMCPCCYL